MNRPTFGDPKLIEKIKEEKPRGLRIQLIIHNEMNELVVSHIKLVDANGKYIKFAKQSDTLIKAIAEATIEVKVPHNLDL